MSDSDTLLNPWASITTANLGLKKERKFVVSVLVHNIWGFACVSKSGNISSLQSQFANKPAYQTKSHCYCFVLQQANITAIEHANNSEHRISIDFV